MIDKLVFAWYEVWLWFSERLTGWCHREMWIVCWRGYFATKWLTRYRNCPIDEENQIEICFDKHFLFTCSFCIQRRERGEALISANWFIQWLLEWWWPRGCEDRALGGEEVGSRHSSPNLPMTVPSGEIKRAFWALLLYLLSKQLNWDYVYVLRIRYLKVSIIFFHGQCYFATSLLSRHRPWLAQQMIPRPKPQKSVLDMPHDQIVPMGHNPGTYMY